MNSAQRLLGQHDEPKHPGAVVAVHYGDYRRQEIWVASGTNIGNWYPLGGEFGRPKVVGDTRTDVEKLTGRPPWVQPPGTIPPHPHWEDVLARGPVTLLSAGGAETYRRGWRAGRRNLWEAMETLAEEDPPGVTGGALCKVGR